MCLIFNKRKCKIVAMIDLTVSSKSPAAISSAIKRIKEMVSTGSIKKDTPVHLTLESGTYRELVRYNMSNPIVIEGASGNKPENCVIQADNCEAFNKGAENRSVFVIGPNATDVMLKNFTISNTHVKSLNGPENLDSGEALFFNNVNGLLTAENLVLEGRKNTLFLRGFSRFENCVISGDIDFIYGNVDTALFENCEIRVRDDNRGDFPGFAVKSLALAEKTGFVFSGCRFTGEKRRRSHIYVCRTEGKGSADSKENWDSIAFVNCFISDLFHEELIFDEDMQLSVYPRGNNKTGIREYNTKVVRKNGSVEEADTTVRNIKSYTMTDENYYENYASRYLILRNTPFEKKLASN